MLVTAVALAATLPRLEATTSLSYGRLLGSLSTLVRAHRVLRQAVVVHALIFAAFMAFWSNLALVFDDAPYHLGATAVGLMALVGVAGALAAPLAGHFADRQGPGTVIATGASLVIIAFAIFGLFQGSLVAMVLGVLIIRVGRRYDAGNSVCKRPAQRRPRPHFK